MFANTLTLTINAVAKILNRINQDDFGSKYLYISGTERLDLSIRHTTETIKGVVTNRHNVFVEWKVFATPTVTEKYYSVAFTTREREGSDPAVELQLIQGFTTLLATLDDGLVVGDN